MATPPAFDLDAVHRYFSAYCFNQAWTLIEKPIRTAEEDEAMLRLSMASIWHWSQRPDCKPANLSVGYWQISRVLVLRRDLELARRYAQLSLDTAQVGDAGHFTIGYGYEALARVEGTAGVKGKRDLYLAEARRLAALVEEKEDRELLLADLETVP